MPTQDERHQRPFECRTWYLDDCVRENLFGFTTAQFAAARRRAITVGTTLNLVDMNYGIRGRDQNGRHRLYGPFTILSPEPLDSGATAAYPTEGPTVIFKVANPASGPWHGTVAEKYAHFPHRVKIRAVTSLPLETLVKCQGSGCWYCGED